MSPIHLKSKFSQQNLLFRLHLGVHKRMEWNEYKGMEINKMKWNVLNVCK